MRVLPWLVTAGLAALGFSIPTTAHACTCGPVVIPAAASGPQPANGLVLVTSCTDDLPVAQLSVRVDGRAARLVDTGIEVGPYAALLRIEPTPIAGQTVTFDPGLRDDEVWPFVYGPTEWTVGPVDDAPPMASAAVEVHVGDEDGDGIACPPSGPHFAVVLSDMVFDDDVAFVRAELVRERVVTSVGSWSWDSSTGPPGIPLVLHVFAETDDEACIQAFAMDRAGNETRLGSTICEVDPVVVVEDEDELDDRGCTCTSTGTWATSSTSSTWSLVALLILGLRRRP